MATRERRPVTTSGPLTGTFVAACVSAEKSTSKAGNDMIVWTFRLDNGLELRRWTLLRSTDLHQTVTALGLDPSGVKLTAAVGRQCRIQVGHDGMFSTIEAAKPL